MLSDHPARGSRSIRIIIINLGPTATEREEEKGGTDGHSSRESAGESGLGIFIMSQRNLNDSPVGGGRKSDRQLTHPSLSSTYPSSGG